MHKSDTLGRSKYCFFTAFPKAWSWRKKSVSPLPMILSSYVYCYLVQKIPFQLDGWQAVKNDYNANLRPAISLCFICMVLVPEVQKNTRHECQPLQLVACQVVNWQLHNGRVKKKIGDKKLFLSTPLSPVCFWIFKEYLKYIFSKRLWEYLRVRILK